MSSPASKPPKAPLVLLGLLTVATMVGPFLILVTIKGGPRPEWPPDRAVEWWVFRLVVFTVVVLMVGCLTASLWSGPKKTS